MFRILFLLPVKTGAENSIIVKLKQTKVMKLTALCFSCQARKKITKTLLMMKLIAIFLLGICLQLSATGFAQRVTLSEKNVTLQKIFSQIHQQTGHQFFYEDALLDKSGKVDIHVKNVSLEEALKLCFKNLPLQYEIVNKTIIVKKKERIIPIVFAEPPPSIVEGHVSDENGKPLGGVNIKNRRTGKVTAAAADGKFSIDALVADVLDFSYVGYESYTFKITDLTVHPSIILKINVAQLDETVVIGYGTAKRKDLTGSIASVSTKEIKNVPFTSVDQALAGKAAGVQVVQADGSPGGVARIRIRGGASLIGTNDPLYIIDGVPVTIQNRYVQNAAEIVNPIEAAGYGQSSFSNSVSGSFARGLNSLAGLNINDIESIDILKDASATAIYGSKAANGVVIITTKKGKTNQKPVLELNYYAGITSPLKEKVLNAEQYKAIMKEAAENVNTERARLGYPPLSAATAILTNPNFFGKANTDWLGLVLRNGFSQNADISVRGGGTGSRYYTSLAYTKHTGTLIGTDFNRISGKIGLDNEINSKLRFISNIDYGFSTNNITNGIYGQALYAPPTESPFNEDGTYSKLGQISQAYQGFQNPLAMASGINRSKNINILGSLALEYDIMKDLKFRSVASVNYNNYNQLNYVPSYVDIGGFNGRQSSLGGTGSQSNSKSTDAFFENTVTWNKEFSSTNRLNIVAGTSWEKYKESYFSATGKGYPDDNFLNNLTSAAQAVSVQGSDPSRQNSLLSFYLRVNYTLQDKYLFTFTGRSDASSKFAPGNQTGYFPSGAIAWRISEENFLKKAKWIDELKLRVSAGTTGTQNIGDHLWRSLYTPVAYAGNNALVPSQLGNNKIKWESTLQKDLGLDFSFFRSRLKGTFGVYEKITDGLLLNVTPAPSSSYSTSILNIAKIRNRGIELDIRGDIIRNKNFQWNAGFNISKNMSKVLDISGGPFSDPNNRDNLNLGNSIVKEGEPLGLLYGTIITGIITNQKQLDDYKAAFPYSIYYFPFINIGDRTYEIDPATKFWKNDIIGHSYPKFYGGITNTLTYKNVNLIALFTFSYGNQLIYQNSVTNGFVDNLANRGVAILDHYSATNTSADRPRLLYGEINPFTTNKNVFDASFIKLRSVTLSYDLPKKLSDKLKLKTSSFYITGTNLFTITSYPGLDPEVSDDPGSVIGGGRDVSSFPASRGVVVGLRVSL